MRDDDPAPKRRRGSCGVRKPGREALSLAQGFRARGAHRIGPIDAPRSAQHRSGGLSLRGSSAVARESSRGYRSGEVGPGIARLLMARSYIRPAAGAVHDGPETPEDAAVGQGADANDDRPRGSSVRGEMKRPPGRLCSKRSSDEGRQDEQRQQASKCLGTTEWVIHRQPHTGGVNS